MFLKVFRSKFMHLLQFLLLYAIISLSVKASQPILPGNFISESTTTIEFRDFTFLPFSQETKDFNPTRLLQSVDKNKIFPFISFEDKLSTVTFQRYFHFSTFYYSSCLIPVLDLNCILRI